MSSTIPLLVCPGDVGLVNNWYLSTINKHISVAISHIGQYFSTCIQCIVISGTHKPVSLIIVSLFTLINHNCECLQQQYESLGLIFLTFLFYFPPRNIPSYNKGCLENMIVLTETVIHVCTIFRQGLRKFCVKLPINTYT